MREERGQIAGDVLIYEPVDLWGKIGGNVRVIERGKLYVRGAIYGNLQIEYLGRAHTYGQVTGDVSVDFGGKIIISGFVGGDVINNGGRIYIDGGAKITGKIRTRKGETRIEPRFLKDPANKDKAR